MWSDAPLPVLRVQSEATSPWHQPLRVEAVVLPLCLSLCVTPLRHKEPQSGLIIFGLFYSLRLWTGASTLPRKQPHTDVITDVKKKTHSIYDTPANWVSAQKHSAVKRTKIQLSFMTADLNFLHDRFSRQTFQYESCYVGLIQHACGISREKFFVEDISSGCCS